MVFVFMGCLLSADYGWHSSYVPVPEGYLFRYANQFTRWGASVRLYFRSLMGYYVILYMGFVPRTYYVLGFYNTTTACRNN
jgi:hypothetical protein